MLATSALAATPRLARARSGALPTARRRGGPKKLIKIFMPGGMDDLYTVDPKEVSEVRPSIAPVYATSELVTHKSTRLGPAWQCLEPYVHRMQVIKGVQVNTVSHEIGQEQVAQLRRSLATNHDANFITLAGETMSPQAPLHAVDLNLSLQSRGRILIDQGAHTLTELHKIANDDARWEVARDALKSAGSTTCSGDACDSFEIVGMLLDKLRGTVLPSAPPPAAHIALDEWPSFARNNLAKGFDGSEFAWALYLIANGITPTVQIAPQVNWDTHGNNFLQAPLNHQFALFLRHLLDGLQSTSTPEGRPLLDEVGIVILSELGRFPYQNTYRGKDHFPQISVVLIGPGLEADTFGETGPEMMGSEVSPRTGRPGRDGGLLTIDDVGRTILEWIGHPAARGLGYDGCVLDFCFA